MLFADDHERHILTEREQTILKYFGVLISKESQTLANINYDSLHTKVKSVLQRWRSSPFMSFAQRIESVKK